MDINLFDTIDSENISQIDPIGSTSIHIDDRLDKEIIDKTNKIAQKAILPFIDEYSLDNEISKTSSILNDDTTIKTDDLAFKIKNLTQDHAPSPQDCLEKIDANHLKKINDQLIDSSTQDGSYLVRLQDVIAKLLEQLHQIADKEKLQTDEQKKKFKAFNKEWGSLQEEMGRRGLHFTWISFGMLALQMGTANKMHQEFLGFLSNKGCNQLTELFNSQSLSNQRQVQVLSELAMTEINAKIQKGSADSSSKQELLQILQTALDILKQSSRSY